MFQVTKEFLRLKELSVLVFQCISKKPRRLHKMKIIFSGYKMFPIHYIQYKFDIAFFFYQNELSLNEFFYASMKCCLFLEAL